jgi:acylglycerol lipase
MQAKEKAATACFTNKKGKHIFYRNWKTDEIPLGILLIVHGLNSHSGYYQDFASQLNENGFHVYAMDLCGRGQSDGERYYIADYNDVIADIDLLFTIARSEDSSLPIFVLGHSAGGVFASVYALQRQSKLKGLIAESFAFQVPAPGFALAVIKLLAHIIPHTRLVKLKNEDFSRNRSLVDFMNNDPLLSNEKQPAKTMQQLLSAAGYLKKGMSAIRLPLLILHGTADKATKPSGSKYFFEHASSDDKQLKLYEGHYHDLLNDTDNEIVVKDIIHWLRERT